MLGGLAAHGGLLGNVAAHGGLLGGVTPKGGLTAGRCCSPRRIPGRCCSPWRIAGQCRSPRPRAHCWAVLQPTWVIVINRAANSEWRCRQLRARRACGHSCSPRRIAGRYWSPRRMAGQRCSPPLALNDNYNKRLFSEFSKIQDSALVRCGVQIPLLLRGAGYAEGKATPAPGRLRSASELGS